MRTEVEEYVCAHRVVCYGVLIKVLEKHSKVSFLLLPREPEHQILVIHQVEWQAPLTAEPS